MSKILGRAADRPRSSSRRRPARCRRARRVRASPRPCSKRWSSCCGISFLSLGLRAGLVVAIAIPLVLAITFVVMEYARISLQRISLGALIIALGLLVTTPSIAVEMMVARLEVGDPLEKAATQLHLHGLSDADGNPGYRRPLHPDWPQHRRTPTVNSPTPCSWSLLSRCWCRGLSRSCSRPARRHDPAPPGSRVIINPKAGLGRCLPACFWSACVIAGSPWGRPFRALAAALFGMNFVQRRDSSRRGPCRTGHRLEPASERLDNRDQCAGRPLRA